MEETSKATLRFSCLELAVGSFSGAKNTAEILKRAKEFYLFCYPPIEQRKQKRIGFKKK